VKINIVIMTVVRILSACNARTAPSVTEQDETTAFCQAVVTYVISQYDLVPRRIKQSTYQLDEANSATMRLVDLQHIKSDYDVILQHQGQNAVFDYCLARNQAPRLE